MKATLASMFAAAALALAGCETNTPNSNANNTDLVQTSKSVVQQMESADNSLQNVIDNSYAYAVFPEVGNGAVGIGGASGRGVVYQQGQVIGTTVLRQGSIGPQIGGETYSELIIFKNADALSVFKTGHFELGADASATLIKAGAAAATQFNNGARVFVFPKGGLMAGASINGQSFTFTPTGNGSM
jgi:lipid-binding SYLF domain-containing protein